MSRTVSSERHELCHLDVMNCIFKRHELFHWSSATQPQQVGGQISHTYQLNPPNLTNSISSESRELYHLKITAAAQPQKVGGKIPHGKIPHIY